MQFIFSWHGVNYCFFFFPTVYIYISTTDENVVYILKFYNPVCETLFWQIKDIYIYYFTFL